jgi:hypothetical protein
MDVSASSANSALGTTLQSLQSNAGNPLAIAQILQQNEKGTNTGAILQAAQATEKQNNNMAMLQALQPANSAIYNILTSVESASLYSSQAALATKEESTASNNTPDIIDSLIHPAAQTADQAAGSQGTSEVSDSSGDSSGILDSLIHPSLSGGTDQTEAPGSSDFLDSLLNPATDQSSNSAAPATGSLSSAPSSDDPSDVLDLLLNPAIGTVDLTGMPNALQNLSDTGSQNGSAAAAATEI